MDARALTPGALLHRCTATEGGYLRLSLENVAGGGGIQSVELRRAPLAVSHHCVIVLASSNHLNL
jgi:hypothetical protein